MLIYNLLIPLLCIDKSAFIEVSKRKLSQFKNDEKRRRKDICLFVNEITAKEKVPRRNALLFKNLKIYYPQDVGHCLKKVQKTNGCVEKECVRPKIISAFNNYQDVNPNKFENIQSYINGAKRSKDLQIVISNDGKVLERKNIGNNEIPTNQQINSTKIELSRVPVKVEHGLSDNVIKTSVLTKTLFETKSVTSIFTSTILKEINIPVTSTSFALKTEKPQISTIITTKFIEKAPSTEPATTKESKDSFQPKISEKSLNDTIKRQMLEILNLENSRDFKQSKFPSSSSEESVKLSNKLSYNESLRSKRKPSFFKPKILGIVEIQSQADVDEINRVGNLDSFDDYQMSEKPKTTTIFKPENTKAQEIKTIVVKYGPTSVNEPSCSTKACKLDNLNNNSSPKTTTKTNLNIITVTKPVFKDKSLSNENLSNFKLNNDISYDIEHIIKEGISDKNTSSIRSDENDSSFYNSDIDKNKEILEKLENLEKIIKNSQDQQNISKEQANKIESKTDSKRSIDNKSIYSQTVNKGIAGFKPVNFKPAIKTSVPNTSSSIQSQNTNKQASNKFNDQFGEIFQILSSDKSSKLSSDFLDTQNEELVLRQGISLEDNMASDVIRNKSIDDESYLASKSTGSKGGDTRDTLLKELMVFINKDRRTEEDVLKILNLIRVVKNDFGTNGNQDNTTNSSVRKQGKTESKTSLATSRAKDNKYTKMIAITPSTSTINSNKDEVPFIASLLGLKPKTLTVTKYVESKEQSVSLEKEMINQNKTKNPDGSIEDLIELKKSFHRISTEDNGEIKHVATVIKILEPRNFDSDENSSIKGNDTEKSVSKTIDFPMDQTSTKNMDTSENSSSKNSGSIIQEIINANNDTKPIYDSNTVNSINTIIRTDNGSSIEANTLMNKENQISSFSMSKILSVSSSNYISTSNYSTAKPSIQINKASSTAISESTSINQKIENNKTKSIEFSSSNLNVASSILNYAKTGSNILNRQNHTFKFNSTSQSVSNISNPGEIPKSFSSSVSIPVSLSKANISFSQPFIKNTTQNLKSKEETGMSASVSTVMSSLSNRAASDNSTKPLSISKINTISTAFSNKQSSSSIEQKGLKEINGNAASIKQSIAQIQNIQPISDTAKANINNSKKDLKEINGNAASIKQSSAQIQNTQPITDTKANINNLNNDKIRKEIITEKVIKTSTVHVTSTCLVTKTVTVNTDNLPSTLGIRRKLKSAEIKLEDTRGIYPKYIEINIPLDDFNRMIDSNGK